MPITSIPYPGITPTSIGGCSMWFDGTDPSGTGTVPANGASVSTWFDKSGTGNTLSAVSSQPTYTRSAQNGQGCLTFNGSQNIYKANLACSNFAGTSQYISIFVVFSLSNTNNGSSFSCPFSWVGASVPRIAMTWEGADGLEMDVGSTNFRTSFTTPVIQTNNTFYMASYWKNGTVTQYNLNGSNAASGTARDSPNLSSNAYDFNVGNGFSSPAYWMKGNIGEIIFYTSTLSNSDFQKVEGYLAQKWGLTSSLPGGHPGLSQTFYIPGVVTKPRVFMTKQVYPLSFTPMAIGGCVLWLDGADSTTMTLSGSNVSRWADKSSAGNHATQSTGANQPYLSNSGMVFSSNQWFQTNVSSTPSAECFFIVTATGYTGCAFTGPQVHVRETILFNGSYAVGLYGGGDITYQGGSSGAITEVGAKTINDYQFTSSSIVMNTNGAQTTSNACTIVQNFSTSTGTWIGAAGYTPLNAKGTINEILCFQTTLSTSQINQVQGYLAWKWGVQGNLPRTHTYYNAPPTTALATPTGITTNFMKVTQPYYYTPVATGGTIVTSNGYRTHTFTTVGSNTFTLSSQGTATVQALVVGGGGAGGGNVGGGGGGGAAIFNSNYTLTLGTYSVTVGNGGAIDAGTGQGQNGGSSTFNTITAVGGGAGGVYNANAGAAGACGGGASTGRTYGTGSVGYNGGSASGTNGGGGGGMGSVGSNGGGGGYDGGAGGSGATYTIGGASYTVCGGGGGAGYGVYGGVAGAGGSGGGANGTIVNNTPGGTGVATPNTGGGGGGGTNNVNDNASPGASGIVIISYVYP